MLAMVLAAGLGTRLRPLTDFLPKPLVPIGDRPMLAHVARRLRDAACERLVVNAHHHADKIAAFASTEKIEVSREDDDLLGTAGGLAHAVRLLGDEGDVLVHNGDVLVEMDLRELTRAHGARNAAATLAIVRRARGEGNVGIDAHDRVVRLRKETFSSGEISGGDFTGVHVVSSRTRATLPEKGCMVGDVYMPLLRKNAGKMSDLYVYDARDFVDVGSIDGYLCANMTWLGDRASFVGRDASVSPRVVLDRVVVGANARVVGEGTLSRVVVWPDAIAHAPLANTVICSDASGVDGSRPTPRT